jgi:phosphohistidine phosphatase SixA
MLKQLFLMHCAQGHSEALTEQGIRQATLLANGPMADEVPPHVIILCAPSPQAKQIAEIIARKFSMSRRVVPVKTTDSLDEYGNGRCNEKDIQALEDIEAAMQQHSVVLVVTDPLRVEGISMILGQDVKLKNTECLIYERQQGLIEKGGPLTLTGRLTVNDSTPNNSVTLPKSSFSNRFFHFVQDHMTCRGVRTGALVSAATLAFLGIIAEVDGRFRLFGVTEMKVIAGQEQPSVHIPLPWAPALYHRVKLADQVGRKKYIPV